jgi:hypothetical protein
MWFYIQYDKTGYEKDLINLEQSFCLCYSNTQRC